MGAPPRTVAFDGGVLDGGVLDGGALGGGALGGGGVAAGGEDGGDDGGGDGWLMAGNGSFGAVARGASHPARARSTTTTGTNMRSRLMPAA